MTTFDDRLLAYLMREHGDLLDAPEDEALDPPPGSVSAHRRWRPASRLPVQAGLALAGAAAVFALTSLGSSDKVAYAVTKNSDGTVMITLREILGVSGINQELADLGVRAKAYQMDPTCGSVATEVDWTQLFPDIVPKNGPSLSGEPASVTIAPAAIPPDTTLILAAREATASGDTGIIVRLMLVDGPPPPCVGMVMRDPSPPAPGVGQRIEAPTGP
jgi:hypothetical protein